MSGFLPRLLKRSKKHKKKEQFKALPLMRYLIYLVLATTITSGVSLSRFYTSSQAGDIARVAKFDVEITSSFGQSDDTDVTDVQGHSKTYTFTVKNNSEVAVRVRAVNPASDNSPYNSQSNYEFVDESGNKIDNLASGTGGWFELTPKGLSDDTRRIKFELIVSSGGDSKQVEVVFEYEQID